MTTEEFDWFPSAYKRYWRTRPRHIKVTRSPSRKIRYEGDFIKVMYAMFSYLVDRERTARDESEHPRETVERTRISRSRRLIRMSDDELIIGRRLLLKLSPLLRDELELWDKECESRLKKQDLLSR